MSCFRREPAPFHRRGVGVQEAQPGISLATTFTRVCSAVCFSRPHSVQRCWIRTISCWKNGFSHSEAPLQWCFVSERCFFLTLKWKGSWCLCLFWENSTKDKHCQWGPLGSTDRARTPRLLRAGNFGSEMEIWHAELKKKQKDKKSSELAHNTDGSRRLWKSGLTLHRQS